VSFSLHSLPELTLPNTVGTIYFACIKEHIIVSKHFICAIYAVLIISEYISHKEQESVILVIEGNFMYP
jgi:hypothetical protein